MSFRVAGATDCAPSQSKQNVRVLYQFQVQPPAHYTPLNSTTLHPATLHYTTLHFTRFYYTTLHPITVNYTTLNYNYDKNNNYTWLITLP